MKSKIVVVVSGGNVTDIYSSDSTIEVNVLDFDNILEESPCVDSEKLFQEATKDAPHSLNW